MGLHLNSSVAELPGIGGKAEKDLKNLGIISIRDLLWYVPFRYDDYSLSKPINELRSGDQVTLTGEVTSIHSRLAKNKKVTITEAEFETGEGSIKVIWFNQPYLEKQLKPGRRISLAGRIDHRFGMSLMNPIYEPEGKQIHTGRIVPVYGLSGSLTMRRLRAAIHTALNATDEMDDWIPKDILDKESFPVLSDAIANVHFPESQEVLNRSIERIKFGELFLHQLMFAEIREDRKKRSTHSIATDESYLKQFVAQLPFELTKAQRVSAWEIVQDISSVIPMNRLLEGDVGSGKTVVAAIAAAQVLKHGHSVAYLAPTEILAEQQYEVLSDTLKDFSVGLRTRTQKEDVKGSSVCIVGTHALLQEGIKIPNLALVIVDEQHRFGVKQRHALLERDPAPHLLSMTATPIPRSLALSLYGDLDLSILNELPKGRKPVATAIVEKSHQPGMWSHIKSQISYGRQLFVICPLIDPSDKLGSKSVTDAEKELKSGSLKEFSIEVLHGKLKTEEKQERMKSFQKGKTDVLISTTVVEVGVDIPNASTMVILGAERFGLAQLHQLRGRVGRSDVQSYCYLLPDTLSSISEKRLKAMVETTDGFKLAEVDLELRGPGNIFGNSQSGFPDFRLATVADVELMKKAHDWSDLILKDDPELENNPLLRQKVKTDFASVHLE